MRKYIYTIPLVLIFLFNLVIRVISVNSLPPSLNWDEVSHGYNAYSILKTGKDEWGTTLPLIFRAYGDFKLPIYIYLTVPFVALFGLNALSVKLVSIIAGSLIPIVLFFIVRKIFPKNKILPYIAAIIASLSPWSIFLSRIALEANLFLLLFSLSFYFLLIENFGLSSLLYAFSLFTYNSSRVLLPFYLIVLLFFIFKKKKFNWKHSIGLLIFTASIIIFSFQTLSNSGQARYKWVTILDQGSINKINELRQIYPRFLVNKFSYFSFTAAKNYIAHFNPSYLFFNGGSQYQFNIPNFHLITPLFIPFFLIGLFVLFKKVLKKDKISILLLIWLLISPIPSAITRDAPHTLRSITILPIAIIIITLGIGYFSSTKLNKLLYPYLIISLIISQYSFWIKYKDYTIQYSQAWQYGYSQAVNTIKTKYADYGQIMFTKKYGEPHEFILFNYAWNPKTYQNNKQWDYHADWYWVNGFDKFSFINDWEIPDISSKINNKTLLVTSHGNYSQSHAKLLETINFLDGQPAFDIVSYYETK